MRWTFACAGCGQVVRASDLHQARTIHCPVCGRALPTRPPEPAPAPRPPWVSAAGWRRVRLAAVGACLVVVTAVLSAGVVARMRRSAVGPPVEDWAAREYSIPQPGMMERARGGRLSAEPLPPVPGGGLGTAVPPGGVGVGRPPGGEGLPGDELLLVPAEMDLRVDRPAPGSRPALPLAGRIDPFLTIAVDARLRRLVTCDVRGELRWYDQATLRLLGSCRLAQPAYQMVISPLHRTLVVAAARPGTLLVGLMGDLEHGMGDLYTYDLDALYKQTADQAAQPARSLLLGLYVSTLVVGRGGDKVYYLGESGREDHIGEVHLGSFERGRRHWLRHGGAAAMGLAPDADVLYAVSAGRVVGLDLVKWKETTSVLVTGTTYELVVGRRGRVYLADRRPSLQVVVVDMHRREPLARWVTNLEGRTYLMPSFGTDRLYVGTSAVLTGSVLALDVGGDKAVRPTVAAVAEGSRDRLLRGPVFLTPDSRLIVTGSGLVFRAPGPV